MSLPSTSKVWLVTGCSSGLGRELALAILRHGDRVIASARKINDLNYLQDFPGSKEKALALVLDVGEPELQLKDKVEAAIDHFGRIDVLVNNAGFVASGVWEETSFETVLEQFQTNFFGALKVTRCVLPYMRKNRTGTVLFMGSISGWLGVGAGGPYSASKFAIEGAAECLAKETAPLGIRTHILVLGQFRTNILNVKRKQGNLEGSDIPDYDFVKAEMTNRHITTDGKQPGDPRTAVQKILDIVHLENLTEEQRRTLPLRIPLGTDALNVMELKCSETLRSLRGWEDFARSTDFPDPGADIPSYVR